MGNEDGTSNESRDIENASGSGSGNECNEVASTGPNRDSEHENERILHSRIRATMHEDAISAIKKIKASHKSSPSSDSSSEFVIEVDIRLFSKSKTKASSSVTSHSDVQNLTKHPKVDDTECSTSLDSDLTHESLPNLKTSTTSPPVQVMERPSGFDPNRIPSSVFACKSQKEADWSTASNDSLFSLQIGNNSFSRDHRHKFSVDFHHKSLGSDDFSKHGGVGKPPLAVKGKGSVRNNVKAGKQIREIAAVDRRVIDDPLEIVNYERDEKVPELVYIEDASAGDQKKQSSGHGSCCSYTCANCCCCTWPRCSSCFKFPSCEWLCCYCCKWPSCSSCFKFPSCGLPSCKWLSCCCCKWPSCSWRKCWSCCWPCGCCCSSKPVTLYSRC